MTNENTACDCVPSPKRQSLMLVMTEYCNLRCVYCYEHKGDKHVLPLETAQTAIIEAFQKPGFDELEIDFFGGEPFAAFKRITEICEWTWSRKWPKPYIFFVTTNGTLVHGKIQEWLKRHKKQIVVGFSLDGTPEMHNANRSNSYADIDFEFFKEQWPFQPVKMTVSQQTLPSLAEGVIHIHKQGLKLVANTAEGIKWNPEDFEIFERELKKLADFYLENPSIEPVDLLNMNINILSLAESGDTKPINYCGTGVSLTAIDVTGKRYPCQTFMPMSGAKGDIDEITKLLFKAEKNRDDPKCKECPLLDVCPTCYGLNYVHNGSPFIRDENTCKFQKIRAKGTAYLWAGMLTQRDRNYAHLVSKNDTDLHYMIKAIEYINDKIHV